VFLIIKFPPSSSQSLQPPITELSNTHLHSRSQSRQIPQGFKQWPKHSAGTWSGLCWDYRALQAAINQESNVHQTARKPPPW